MASLRKSQNVDNTNCCVYGCSSKKSKNKNLSFHLFPRAGEKKVKIENKLGQIELVDKRKAWILKIRTGKHVSKYMKICSLHFKNEDFILPNVPTKKKMLKSTAVPSQNLPQKPERPLHPSRYRYKSRGDMSHVDEPSTSTCFEESDYVDGLMYEETETTNIKKTLSNKELVAVHALLDLINYKHSIDIGVQVKSGDIFESFVSLIDSDAKLNTLTGISNYNMLESIAISLETTFPSLRVQKLNSKERIILTFIKLKQNLNYVVLSILFKSLTAASCRNIFIDTLNKLYKTMAVCINWPSKEECVNNMPKCFEDFQNVRIVLDCTEIFIQKPRCLCCRLKSYSHYKSHNTIKFLCGVSPAGLITFVSKGYGGRTSDKCIFEDSKLIEKLEPNEDAIMVDKGFRIDEVTAIYGIKLVRPPFAKKNVQMSKEEVEITCKIARARVHIERVFQRVKLFKILSVPVSWNLLTHIDKIFTICCAVTNLSTPVLSDDKFLE